MNLEEKIKNKIDQEKLSPKSKYSFVLREWVVWMFGILSVIIGGLIVSAALFHLRNTHWGIYNVTHDNFFDFLLEFLPFVWIILFSLFVFLTYKFLRTTRRGYKYNFISIIGGTFVLTIVFGIISFNFGAGFVIESKFGPRIPFYKDIEMKEKNLWDNFEKGLFLGMIVKKENDYYLATNKGDFKIYTDDLPKHLQNFFDLDNDEDEIVRIVGNLMEENEIYPCMIFPFEILEKEFFGGKELVIRSEINPSELRINNCKGVRPYKKLNLTK